MNLHKISIPICLIVLALMSFAAISAPPPNLFSQDTPPGFANLPEHANAQRHRLAELNADALSEETIVINLLDDLTIIAIKDRVIENKNGHTWFGHVQDEIDSQVRLTLFNGEFYGVV